jgi:succinoglycan biosynthesis transport protein ExoP
MGEGTGERSSLVDFVRVVRRRKWLILMAAIVVPVVAVVHAARQPALFNSSAQVLLTPQNPALSYAGVAPTAGSDPARYAATQTFLARSPSVARSVVEQAGVPGLTVGSFLGSSGVSPTTNADLLTFWSISGDAAVAQKLANLYASEYTKYRHALDTSAIRAARKQLEARIAALKPSDASLRFELADRVQSLDTTEALQRQATYVSRPASSAVKIQPKPKRDLFLGLGLGVLLGVGLAFLREALDTRLRNGDEIGERLGLPLLGELPTPAKAMRMENRLVMLEQPYSGGAEMFRMLRTSIDLANLDRNARTLMVTSAVEGEGKTTTAANLAVALAAAGRRVILVDLDLRRPTLHRFFQLKGRPGLTDVALGDVALDDALTRVQLDDVNSGGWLSVMPSGPMPPNPGEFVGTAVAGDVLKELRDRSDIVVIDTPPMLHAVEALNLSAHVDAILVVTQLASARRGLMTELRRMLERTPAAKLGFALTGAKPGSSYGGYDEYSPYPYPADDLVS